MRKLIVIMQVSLDGVVQGPGGKEEDRSGGFAEGGWAMPYGGAPGRSAIAEVIAGEFDLLLGRKTYDIWINYWPLHTDDPIGAAFAKAKKFVVTHRPDGLSWATSQRVDGAEGVRALKATDGPELHLWGSSAALQTLIAADLIDEYRLWVFPVVLGSGKRLFETGAPPRGLSLVETWSTPTGVLINTYRPKVDDFPRVRPE
jgi:dihydrofolate reductase